MNKHMYMKLAWQNLKKNSKFYLPYILTIMGTSAAFYIMLALNGAKDLPNSARYTYLTTFVFVGIFVIGFFSVIFLFYTNSFLMKRRNKELGLYNILGLGKRHIAKVLAFETLYTGIFGIGGGILSGILLQKIVTLLLYRLMRFETPYGFYIFKEGILFTFLFFATILFVSLLVNMRRIRVQNPIELLHAGEVGEKEPKTKWLITILGVVCLGAGYVIAVVVNNAMDAFALYFVAVFLVIIGTYCLFTSVSIAVLKLLRKNKKFYYKTTNFIGISGMLYRMKRNAVGLANICILSTMVLVMVSGTLALYVGTEDAIRLRYPADLRAEITYDPTLETSLRTDEMLTNMLSAIESQGRTIEQVSDFKRLTFSAVKRGEGFKTETGNFSSLSAAQLLFCTAKEYAKLAGVDEPVLAKDEVLIYEDGSPIGNQFSIDFANSQNPTGETVTYQVKEKLSSFPVTGDLKTYLMDVYYIVVSDDSVLNEAYQNQNAAYPKYPSKLVWEVKIDIDGTEEEKIACSTYISDAEAIHATASEVGSWKSYRVESRDANREDFYSMHGGFFFLGMFLGILFILATVLIIYYKQISEGYEDRERYQIMQKVGLDKKEIKRSINSQVKIVFFMPMVVAIVHIAFNFKLMRVLLTLFQLTNTKLTFLCTVVTLVAFILLYCAVYALTAKVYYKIVS